MENPRIDAARLIFAGRSLRRLSRNVFGATKTKKWYFHLVNLIGIIWQAVIFLFLLGEPDFPF